MERLTSKALQTIRAEVRRRGWSSYRLAKEPGISPRAAWTIYHGASQKIAWETLDAVLDALGLELRWSVRE